MPPKDESNDELNFFDAEQTPIGDIYDSYYEVKQYAYDFRTVQVKEPDYK